MAEDGTVLAGEPPVAPVDGVVDPVVADPVKDADPTDPPKGEDPPKEAEFVEFTDFTLPDGFNVNDAVMTEFKDVAKELKLDQVSAQKLVDLQTKHAQSQVEAWEGVKQNWVDTAKADKELSEGSFDENVAIARTARDAFGTPELNQALEDTGVGNHPEFIRFMLRVGNAIKEDKMNVGSNPNSGAERTHADILFPNQN